MITRFFSEVAAPAAIACWTAYFIFAALFGASSFRVLSGLEREARVMHAEVEELKQRRETLERRADMLSPASLDADLVDERVRSVLGFARSGDFVLPRRELNELLKRKQDGDAR